MCVVGIGWFAWSRPSDDFVFFPGIAAGPASKTVEREFQEYLNYSEFCEDPMKFWSCHGVLFPRLFKLAKRTLIAPASTACVECVFSEAGIILETVNGVAAINVPSRSAELLQNDKKLS